MGFPTLLESELLAVSKALGDTEFGFTGTEIGLLLSECGLKDIDSKNTKYKRLFNAFCEQSRKDNSTNCVYKFIQVCMEPARGLNTQSAYEKRRFEVNRVLMLKGIEIRDDGNFYKINGNDIEDTQDNVKQAVKYAKNQEWLRYLSRFHHFLQVSVSHRTLEEENSERLMLKYYEYLLRIKTMLHDKYSLDVLYNLEQFPIVTDLLHHMNNRVIKEQYHESYKKNYNTGRWEYLGVNNWLSNLYLPNECLPFDTMPFCSGLRKHVPNISDLLVALDTDGREHEFMARVIKNNTEQKGMLYTPLEQNGEKYKLGNFEDVETLKKIYNEKLPKTKKQQARKLIIDKGYIFIEAYRDDTISIITTIKRLAQSGVSNYSNTVKHWIENSDYNISEEKKKALETMFAKSHVSVIYGAAGTGKTTFINYISNFFKEYSKLYLAYTNPAVNNLKRKVAATQDCEFMTISKFNNRYNNDIKRKYDIIFIDECSTVSNKEMKEFLELADYKLLVLVGDTYQIESIEFGNWFDTIRGFLPESAICELVKPYRSNSKQLQALWDNVRKMEDDILDRLQAGGYSVNLDPSILTPASENEIILCLNYGGLYGINNINHFMQENNNGKEIRRGIQRYKVGDPILFNDLADSFFTKNKEQVPIIQNNMKGRIVDFRLLEAGKVTERIQFDIEIDKPLMNLDDKGLDFQVIGVSEKENSIIRFEVYKNKSTDEDDDSVSKNMVPFQIAYAVSIHKAQGLEYDSVKIIITDDIDELITHSIFYTAITRAREKLKIYWTQSVEKKVLDRIKPKNNHQDISLLKQELLLRK